MEKVVSVIGLLLAAGVAFYLLYINGYLTSSAKRAVMYVGSMRGQKASFTACTGYTKRVVRFQESGTREVHFELELSQGDVTAELLDSKKSCVLRLDRKNRRAVILVEARERYTLVFHFASATGRYHLHWE